MNSNVSTSFVKLPAEVSRESGASSLTWGIFIKQSFVINSRLLSELLSNRVWYKTLGAPRSLFVGVLLVHIL